MFLKTKPCFEGPFVWNAIKQELPTPNQSRDIDFPIWKLNPNGEFHIASIKREVLWVDTSNFFSTISVIFMNLWKPSILKKCKFFLWTCCMNLLTLLIIFKKDFLARISIQIGPLCAKNTQKTLIISSFLARFLMNSGERFLIF